ncbi:MULTISPECIES: hypothetical protein [unclassified Bradyrhizobium]|uniref:hypothetical protein n=1 Tax=unclassified Bradyrhizobium TaxID=2631580 RepID=UPI002915F743|nr:MULTISPECIES: hypothetical protein [unclassified Bradyrhizobium]
MTGKRARYRRLVDGEWVRPVRRGLIDQCCGCGLVHAVDFTIEDGVLFFRARVDRRLTAAARRTKEGRNGKVGS